MSDRQLEGFLRFPYPVVFEADVQDRRAALTIGQHAASINLPRLPPESYRDDPGPELLPPSSVIEHEDSTAGRSWGRVVTSRGHFLAEGGFLSIELPGDGSGFEAADAADDELRLWVTRLTLWLRILTSQDLRSEGPLFWETWETTPGAFIVRDHGVALGRFGRTRGHHAPYAGIGAASVEDWSRALKKASAGEEPDAGRLFLSDAFASLQRQQPRRALLDAAVASELGLTKALRARILEKNEETMADLLLDKATLGRKVQLCGRFDVWRPQRVIARINEPRNDLVHRGLDPSREQARLAIVEAGKILLHHCAYEWEYPYDPADDLEDDD